MEGSRKRKFKQIDLGSHSRSQDPTLPASTKTGIPLQFSDSIYYYEGDPKLLWKFRAISSAILYTKATANPSPIPMNCTKSIGMFLLDSLPNAVYPKEFKTGEEPEYFQQMKRMGMKKLTEIMKAADYHVYVEMLHSGGMAISQKLIEEKKTVEEIGHFLGAVKTSYFTFKDDWRFPPVSEK